LNMSEVMHTASGNLRSKITYVIHVLGPAAVNYTSRDLLTADLVNTFYNCLCYANDTLGVNSVAIPALCSGKTSSASIEVYFNSILMLSVLL